MDEKSLQGRKFKLKNGSTIEVDATDQAFVHFHVIEPRKGAKQQATWAEFKEMTDMGEAMSVLEKLETQLEDNAYNDQSYALQRAKTKVHNQEKYLADLKAKHAEHQRKKMTTTSSKQSWIEKIKQEEEDLKRYKQELHDKEQAFSKHKPSGQNLSTPNRHNNPSPSGSAH